MKIINKDIMFSPPRCAGSNRLASRAENRIRLLSRLLLMLGLVTAMVSAAACAPIQYDHDLVGKVVDNETGKPIPGTVILAVWDKYYNTPAGGHGEYYDAQEAVANENGEFRISGRGLMLFTFVEPSMAYVFKAGYDWVGINYERLQTNGGMVKLQKTDKSIARRRPPAPPRAQYEKIKNYIRESDIDDIAHGIKPSPYWRKENE